MADFLSAYKIVMIHEGGYANDPQDPGGETYAGISRKNFPNWAGWALVDSMKPSDVKMKASDLLQQAVQLFYKSYFWNVLHLDSVNNQAIATELFDTGVNMGLAVAARFLQTALTVSGVPVTIDGNVGPATVNALNASTDEGDILKLLNCYQGTRYSDIILKNPKMTKYFRSWFSRVSL